MAKIEKIIPKLLIWECYLPISALTLPPEQMFAAAAKGGFSNRPSDRGGATMCGITLKTFAAWRKAKGYASTTVDDLRTLDYQQWRAVLKECYWDKFRADDIRNQSTANILVDWLWNSGTAAIRQTQRLLGVKADGVVGAVTLTAINNQQYPRLFFAEIVRAREKYYRDIVKRDPSQRSNLQGWLNRLKDYNDYKE